MRAHCVIGPGERAQQRELTVAHVACRRVYDASMEAYLTALDMNPALTDVYKNIVLLLMDQGDFDGALQLLEDAAQRSPDDLDVMIQLGMSSAVWF